MTITAFVPARSGSKRLPNKNITPLAGKPLVLWTLEACAQAEGVSEVIFSTDSDAYWRVASEYFATHLPSTRLTLDARSADDAGDKVKIFDYLVQARQKIFGERDGAFLMALPTVPLRRAEHIDQAIGLFLRKDRPVFSAAPYDFPIQFAFETVGDAWRPVFDASPMVTGNTRSQDQKPRFHPNGAIYLRKISDLAQPGLVTLYDDAVPYLMDALSSIDIDAESDFAIAQALLSAVPAA